MTSTTSGMSVTGQQDHHADCPFQLTLEDALFCAARIKDITDDLRRQGPPRDLSAPISTLVSQIQSTSALAQERLRGELASLHPGIGWLGEEDQTRRGRDWLFDPIDGAYHFLQGLPLWSSSLVLLDHGRPEMALIYDPALDEMFMSIRGLGATLNGQSIAASQKTRLEAAVVGTAVPPIGQVGSEAHTQALRLFNRVAREVFVVRPMAATSLQLAYVAAGRLDAYWESGTDTGDWLAGSLLVREAGGTVTDLRGDPWDGEGEGILAAGGQLHAPLVRKAFA